MMMYGPITSASAELLPWLIEVTVESTLVVAAAFAAARLLRGRSAAVRHVIWTAALAAVVALPVIEAVVPSRLHVVELVPGLAVDRFGGGAAEESAAPALRLEALGADGASEASVERPERPGEPEAGGTAGGEPPHLGEDGGTRGGSGGGETLAAGLVLVWLLGAFSVVGYLGWGTLVFARAAARGRPLERGLIDRAVADASRPAVAADRVRLRESAAVRVPLSAGVVRPTILLPEGASDWPEARLASVLVHEMAHVRRRDALAHLVGRLACALFWFNPLVWRAARRLRAESERACDDAVLALGTRPSTYASHLFEIAHAAVGERGPVPGLAMARPSEFEGRILDVLAADRRREPAAGRRTIAATAAVVGVTVLALGLVSLDGRPAEARPASLPAAFDAGERVDGIRDDGHGDARADRDDGSRASADGGRAPGDTARNVVADDERAEREPPTDEVERALIGLLDDRASSVRAAAARALGERGVREAVPELIAALGDPHDDVRARAAYALVTLEDPRAIRGLRARLLDRGEEREIREAAAWGIGETETEEAVEALASAVPEIDDERLRTRAVRALGETRRRSAVPVLEGLLFGDDRRMRKSAAAALVKIGSADASSVLLRALGSDDPRVRRLVARALGEG
ncbi:MAG: M56 family metallopeptidase, partial [Gemmatimonadota bacterium]